MLNLIVMNLNDFYARFNKFDFHYERKVLIDKLKSRNDGKVTLSEAAVLKSLSTVNVNKAVGPDKLVGSILKLCNSQLAPVFCKIFQRSVDSSEIPSVWKHI